MELYNAGIDFKIPDESPYIALDMIRVYEPDVAESMGLILHDIATNKADKAGRAAFKTYWLLRLFSSISDMQRGLASSTNVEEYRQTRPNMKGDWPQTEEELAEYINWYKKAFQLIHKDEDYNIFLDGYGVEMKLEFVKDGVKFISAGPDLEFGTADDMSLVRTL